MPDPRDKKKINGNKVNKKKKKDESNATTVVVGAIPEPKRELVKKHGKKFIRLASGKLAPDNGIRAQG